MVDGLLGKKISMTQVFDESGEVIPATVIEAGPCPIVQIKTEDREGYNAVQLGFGAKNEKKLNQPKQGHFKKAGVDSQHHLREFRVADLEGLAVGTTVDAGLFTEGDLVDITGTSKGRGFTGVVKRWGFKGGRASHGDEQVLRHGGSIGQSAWPAKVFKGVKMPGRYGNKRRTVQNLQIVKVYAERNLLVIKGAIPGPRNGLLMIRKAVKRTK
ncbi:50S ribosomal protein L3 [Candidatus Poribacteria bacterium]|jgi:large subunit ribosomal protein L3|nr:50S ribosomal protein L3 [Candidatus Poribacteria bacterium]MDP6748836.1 50S ribosomal protein L3 [Candidatus Poribacteria bacterium]MDP6961206.1 50S ribosomal protein L3 [Dehalococcoidia bacterium]